MQPFWQEQFYNPPPPICRPKVKQALEQARADIAKVLGARGPEIILRRAARNRVQFGYSRHYAAVSRRQCGG